MSNVHKKYSERLHRIRVATKKAEPLAPASEPAADVLTQKIVQELTELKRQKDALTAQVKEIQQERQKQAAELDALRRKQRSMDEHLKTQQEQLASKPQAPTVSTAASKSYIDKKLLVFKVQLACAVVFIGITVTTFLLWPKRDKTEPQQPATTHLPVFEERRAR